MWALKLLLLELCIRAAIGQGSIPLIKTSESSNRRVSQAFYYGLMYITNLEDFNQVFDWENTSFNQATKQSSSVIC